MEPIKIFKGDDTDFNNSKFLSIKINTEMDLTGFKGIFKLGKFKTEQDMQSKTMEIVIPHEVTALMLNGTHNGIFTLIDTQNRFKTLSNTIPFLVTSEVFTQEEDSIDLPVPEGYPYEIIVELGGTNDYNSLQNIPTFEGKPIKGNLTFQSTGIAPLESLDALTTVVNQKANTVDVQKACGQLQEQITTNKNDIDGLGDQVAGTEAKIPAEASETNQLADKAFVNAEIAKNKAALDLKADKSDTYTKTEVDTFVAEQETNLTTVKNDLGDLGDQVSVIEAKIPQAASENNQLADKQFVQDLNSALNFVQWVDSLPETGESKYIYAVPREETDTDGKQIAALYLWDGSAWRGAGAFSLNIDPATLATKAELAGYLPLTGGTMSGVLKVVGPLSEINTFSGTATNGYTRLELVAKDENWTELRLSNNKGRTQFYQMDNGISEIYNSLHNSKFNIGSTLRFNNNKVLDASDKAVANGVASLDANAKVPSEQIPVATASTLGGVKLEFDETTGTLNIKTE